MSIKVLLIEHNGPCSSCDNDEQWAVHISRCVSADAAADQSIYDSLCLTCACALSTKLDKLLREIPTA